MPILTPGTTRFQPIGLFKANRTGVVSLVLEIMTKQPRVARLFHQPPGATEVALLEAIDTEARALKTLSHKNLPVFDRVVEGDGGTWMLFEFVDGKPLSHYYDVEKSIPDEWIVYWFQQLLVCLDALHTHDPPFVVGYIEPADVIIKGDKLLLSDIGLFEDMFPLVAASALHKHPFIHFIAPEKRMSAQTTPAADLFSVAALAFWMATGHAPVASSPAAAARMLAALQDYRPELPLEVGKLISEMLDFYPSQRPASAKAALERLQPFVPSMRGQSPPAPPAQEAFKAAAAATRIMGDEEAEDEEEFMPVKAPAPIFKDDVEDAAPRVTPLREFAEDVGWQLSRKPLTVIGVVVLVALVVLVGVHWATAPAETHVQALMTTLSGSTLRKSSGSWERVREAQPGDVIASGSDGSAMQFGHSILFLEPRTQFECQGRDRNTLSVALSCGQARVETSPEDGLLVRVTSGPDVSVDGNSDVETKMLDADCIITCKRGSATVTASGEVQHLSAGNTAHVPLTALPPTTPGPPPSTPTPGG